MNRRWRAILLLLAGMLVTPVHASADPPSLVVVLVIDQMRSDYIDRYQHQWHAGLTRLLAEGPGHWTKLRQAAQTLVSVLREHIYKEDTILYPMSLRLIHDEADWAELKRRCDKVGY